MKIGIIVHPQTDTTYSVAEKLKEHLISNGHSFALEKIIAVNEEAAAEKIIFEKDPDVTAYDALIFGAPERCNSVSCWHHKLV